MKSKLLLWSPVAIVVGAIFVALTLIEDIVVQPVILATIEFFGTEFGAKVGMVILFATPFIIIALKVHYDKKEPLLKENE